MNLLSIVVLLLIAGLLVLAWTRGFMMTYALIVTNVVVFGITLIAVTTSPGTGYSVVVDDLAFKPSYIPAADWSHAHTLLSAAFLHAGFAHLFGNMLILLLAGVPFEERLGRRRFLALYLFTAVGASLFHALWVGATEPARMDVPALGASGAVFGVLGGFAAAYPRDKFPIFPIPMLVMSIFMRNVPVVVGVVILAVLEGFAMFVASAPGVAHAAHLGGAAAGAAVAVILRPARTPTEKAQPKTIDYAVLERLAPDPRTRAMVDKIRQNSDHAELQRAWLDRVLVHLRCPQCGDGFAEIRPGTLECEQGHKERYVA